MEKTTAGGWRSEEALILRDGETYTYEILRVVEHTDISRSYKLCFIVFTSGEWCYLLCTKRRVLSSGELVSFKYHHGTGPRGADRWCVGEII